MTIREIEKRIIEEAESQSAKIQAEAETSIQQLEKVHAKKKETLKNQILQDSKHKAEALSRSYLVPARLTSKKSILEEKQRILDQIYGEIQKEKKLSKAEINKLREDTEIKAAALLFGK